VAPVVGYSSRLYGQAGVEQALDPILHGDAGHGPWETWFSYLLSGAPPPGLDVQLTLDLELQRIAAREMRSERGALVMLAARGGDILALVSSPTFDPMRFEEEWEDLINSPEAPLLNRATQSLYQPGLSLAPFLLAWAEERGLASLDQRLFRPVLEIEIEGRRLSCARASMGESPFTLGASLQLGCPDSILAITDLLSAQEFTTAMRAFGFDEQPDLPLQVASAGVSSLEPDELSSEMLGQGELGIAPIQMARAFAALANSGELPPLRLIQAIENPEEQWIPQIAEHPSQRILGSGVSERLMAYAPSSSRGVRGFVALALSGGESDYLTWFLGSQEVRGSRFVTVVVLERKDPRAAIMIGTEVLAALTEEN
jgi:cell division protein FtsI/penicillin-binding protein 2